MKNRDKTAYPISGSYNDMTPEVIIPIEDGFTKRELGAFMALQGILSSRKLQVALLADKISWSAFAVTHADALLAELDKTESNRPDQIGGKSESK